MRELAFFNGLSIDCRGQDNIGAVLQYLDLYSKISYYSSREKIIKEEFIEIYSTGIYDANTEQPEFIPKNSILGVDFLKEYAFEKIYYSPDFDKFASSVKSKVKKSYEKMEKAYKDGKEVCEDGASPEYHKGISNFYNEIMCELGNSGELTDSKNIAISQNIKIENRKSKIKDSADNYILK